MQDVNVLVTFCSRMGETERLALAAAVGAVQARANIRLRWLRETADDRAIESVPGWKENRDRMDKEYIAPREADALWADAMILGTPARLGISSVEWKGYVDLLEAVRSQGKLHGKIGTALIPGSVEDALARLGLIVVPRGHTPEADAVESARLQGRRVTEVARALRRIGVD